MAPFKKSPKAPTWGKTTPPKKPLVGAEPKAAFNWFPGHMMKAMREIQAKVNLVDIVIEIRDARIPIVSGNQALTKSMSGKTRLILLNKANLADPVMNEKWAQWFEQQGEPFLFINCLDKSSVKQVLTKARGLIEKKRRESNEAIKAKGKYRLMVIGLPNTGKSTFINSIANRNAVKVADKPGQTQHNLWVQIDDEMELLDTPGIMPPEIERDEHKLWLCLINAVPAAIVGEEDPACYLIKYLLKHKITAFQQRYKLDSFELSVDEALVKIATVRGCLKQKGLPDLDRVYKLVLQDFRAGELGRISLGSPTGLVG
jgi:ribosome biogenesis GTPase A